MLTNVEKRPAEEHHHIWQKRSLVPPLHAMVMPHQTIITETARERETFKYDALTISTAGLHGSHPPKPIPSSFLSSTPEPALTAFAQLGLFKLKAARSMISLFDRKYQHIVADALRTPNGPEDHLESNWFNGLTFERATSVCEHVVTGLASSHSIPGTACGLTPGDIPVSIVNSLNEDARFCHIQDSGRQFYAGVPIRSPTGINIGVYCVFDDKPRPQGLNADEVRFMRDLSRIIMNYLESKRSHEWYRREQRMVRGLGSFVKGKATLWNPNHGTSEHPASFQDLPGMSEGLLNKKLQPATTTAVQDQQQVNGFPLEAPIANITPAIINCQDRGEVNDDATIPSQPNSTAAPAVASTSATKSIPSKSPTGSSDPLRKRIDHVFSKAANIVRESIEVEGVLFLDATVRSSGGLVGKRPSEVQMLSKAQNSSSSPSSSDESARSQSDDVPAVSHPVCNVLGFSTSDCSSIVGDTPPRDFAPCNEWFLQRLLRRYPHGQIWNFEADGTISDHSTSSDSDKTPTDYRRPPSPSDSAYSRSATPPSSPKKRLNTAARIIKMFPGARSVAMVPMWDTQTGRWFAGGFVWTRIPTRAFSDENELTYLRVFGLTTMAEVARLKTRAADKAKTDILGSISHELRSPLHGLVGAVELLRHTALNALQVDILRTIEASGRTLLDTIDHLLDFVKINSKHSLRTGRRNVQTGLRQRSNLPAPETLPLPELPIQLDLLAEDVVESVFAGSSYLTRSETHSTSFTSMQGFQNGARSRSVTVENFQGDHIGSLGAVQIYLDIDHTVKWSFYMHPGAFRRIIMNLFGNSLKFTKSGFIRISMRQESQHKQRSSSPSSTRVLICVSDSGKGMSEEYLHNHLFTPFSQEDQFALGTGLGLSLVRNMTMGFGGTIDVSSKVGQGTTITVALPLSPSAEEATDGEEAIFWQSIKTLSGKRVQLCGFERETRARESFRPDDVKQRSQYQLMEGICQDMLQMNVVSAQHTGSNPPDFVVCCADQESNYLDTETAESLSQCPYVLVCQDLASAHRSTEFNDGRFPTIYEVCSQPIGPRKLARALLACQLRWKSGPGSSIKSTLEFKDSIGLELGATALTIQLAQQRRKDIVSAEPGSPTSAEVKDFAYPSQQPLKQPTGVIAAEDNVAYPDSVALKPQKSILIVDDNEINLKIMAAYLSKLNHSYTTAVNGLEALEIYTSDPSKYSCLLTDISMPIMDGIESTRRIREFEVSGGHTPIVVITLTGLSGGDVRQNALANGVDLFLTRPLPFRGLKEALVTMGLQ